MFSENRLNVWESISDLMTGLMMVFLFIGLAFWIEWQSNVEDYARIKRQIYADLSDEFSEDEMRTWGAEIDPKTMAITFKEPDVLFDVGSNSLKPRFQEILSSFFPRYIAVLRKPKYDGKISEIRIEGYASLEDGEDPNLDAVYFYNMQLSQERARNVLRYIFGLPALQSQKQWLQTNIITNGYSYGKTSGNRNYDRRVEFRVMTIDEQEMKKLVEDKI